MKKVCESIYSILFSLNSDECKYRVQMPFGMYSTSKFHFFLLLFAIYGKSFLVFFWKCVMINDIPQETWHYLLFYAQFCSQILCFARSRQFKWWQLDTLYRVHIYRYTTQWDSEIDGYTFIIYYFVHLLHFIQSPSFENNCSYSSLLWILCVCVSISATSNWIIENWYCCRCCYVFFTLRKMT